MSLVDIRSRYDTFFNLDVQFDDLSSSVDLFKVPVFSWRKENVSKRKEYYVVREPAGLFLSSYNIHVRDNYFLWFLSMHERREERTSHRRRNVQARACTSFTRLPTRYVLLSRSGLVTREIDYCTSRRELVLV
jgi:hypothetical protein